MIDLVIIISIIFCVILIADIILTFRGIRNNQKRFAEAINKMKWERTGRTTLKTNIYDRFDNVIRILILL